MGSARVAVVDYGGGNIGSLLAALERHQVEFTVTGEPEVLDQARGVIFPGDGAFGATMEALRVRGLDRAIVRAVEAGRPFLGICVGMQILFDGSTEFGATRGLGILRGEVARFAAAPRVPHMGWNTLEPVRDHPFVAHLDEPAYAYFLHSYRAPVTEATVAAATYGDRFSAVVAQRNVMGTQFHPEKSQNTGKRLLENYLQLLEHEETIR